jgi:hypothetical protein
MRVEVQANQFRGLLNGQQVTDSSADTYRSGGIGVWTNPRFGDFDDVQLIAR